MERYTEKHKGREYPLILIEKAFYIENQIL